MLGALIVDTAFFPIQTSSRKTKSDMAVSTQTHKDSHELASKTIAQIWKKVTILFKYCVPSIEEFALLYYF